MADGYGFGGEGDWKTAAMVRAMKVMSRRPARRRLVHGGLHVPLRADGRPESSARTCSRSARRSPRAGRGSRSTRCPSAARRTRSGSCSTRIPGPAVAACVTDMGDRFRMVASVVDVVAARAAACRSLPVARAMWRPRPDLRTNAAAWIHAGGSHHTEPRLRGDGGAPARLRRDVRRRAASSSTSDTSSTAFRDQLRWNDLYHHLAKGL